MILYLSATTNIPDVYIDFIMVKLNSGEEVSLNWDESDITRDEDGFQARYKGVYFDEDYANGKINELQGMEITDIGLYYESSGSFHFLIDEMQFDDNGKELTFQTPTIPPNCSGMEGLLITFPLEPAIQVPLTKREIELLKESLDVTGDKRADCEGYSAGEEYWALKEKLEGLDGEPQKPISLDQVISATQNRSILPRNNDICVAKEPER